MDPIPFGKDLYYVKHIDGRYLYIAGRVWLARQSPYDFNTFLSFWKRDLKNSGDFYLELKEGQGAFIYPPTIAIFSLPLALFSWKNAQILLDTFNVIAFLSVLFFSINLTKRFLPTTLEPGKIWLGIGMIGLFMSAVPVTIYSGQTPLLATAGCLGAIYFFLRGHIIIAALFIVIASIKPQLSLLPLIYLFILASHWRLLAWSTLFVSIITMIVLVMGGNSNPLLLIQDLLTTQMSLKPNTASGLPGLYWFMSKIGIQHPITLISPIASILFVTGLTLFFKHHYQTCFTQHTSEIIKIKVLMLLIFYLCLVTLLMPLHEYDHVILIPVFGIFWILRGKWMIFLLPGLLLISRPNKIAYLLQWMIEEGEKPALITGKMIASFGVLWITIFFALVFFYFTQQAIQKIESNPLL